MQKVYPIICKDKDGEAFVYCVLTNVKAAGKVESLLNRLYPTRKFSCGVATLMETLEEFADEELLPYIKEL